MSINILTKGLKYLEVPPFTFNNIPQLGNSYAYAKFFYTTTKRISFPRILNKPVGGYFTPVLWWKNLLGAVGRRKLWTNNRLVLYEPYYDGAIMRFTFAIEIWPDVGVLNVHSDGLVLETSYMVIPEVGCPPELLVAADYLYTLGTDPVMDVGNNTWNAVEGDYWTVNDLGFTTFVEGI